MKKLALALLSVFVAISIAFAAPVGREMIAFTSLDDAPTGVASAIFNIHDYSKLAFFVLYDETEVGETLSAAVTLDISYDGTNFLDASFYDYGGGATLQTSETITADGWYYLWFNKDLSIPYVRMVINATNSDADDKVNVTAYMTGIR